MQIILMEKVVNLGQLGDVVKVKDGYARNFLIPQGKAKRATSNNIAAFEARRAELEAAEAARLAAAQAQAEAMADLVVTVAQKAGVDGKLFGSVTNADIAEALGKAGQTVEKMNVRMPDGPLKSLGEHAVTVALHQDVVVEVKVVVVAEV
ncbi:MAG: 50S ribosomal protein L9 [Betaproteobacteria bacterium]|jgi:large subunit ribosomal protein L9|nr:50S ribosomal protein L9 [Betaproteobacteria bacterium]NBR98183.1 50S ribosomal protein L9 [Betaproteobacteria bacterium]NBS94057.1 50S ribosomal protein L9 [Betaproteobacteria bacterium]NBY52712.1 50S ribosomal protein L9 [Betaproteobacteria bacterium]NCA24312.1 50S ribosomal protein L9 [Betaproteobacteria bacterium]